MRLHLSVRAFLAALGAALALGVAGCGGGESQAEPTDSVPGPTATANPPPDVEGKPPSESQLVGVWREAGGPAFFQFERDGTFALDTDLDVPYWASGTYELEGDEVSFHSGGPICVDSWKWRVGIVEGDEKSEDRLHIVLLDPLCTEPSGTEGTFDRL